MRATILVVDDSEDVLELIKTTLSKEHDVRVAGDAPTALKLAFEEPRPDLILLDVEMPDVSGYNLCKTLKGSPAVADIPVVFLTGRIETRDVVQGFQLGAIDYLAKPVSAPVLAVRIRSHLELIERRNRQDEMLRSRGAELEQTRLELIRRLGRAMEYHESSAIGNRVIRLGHYARALSQAAGARIILSDMMMKAAPLHDIGKVGVPAAVLRKAGQLTIPEREQMQRHPAIGAEIIGSHNDPLLKLARTLAFTHHERWDGSGYPSGAAGNDIPWAGRAMAIVDAWESMTVTQFHREPLPLDLAADEITKGAGKQFDPAMVTAFRKALTEFRQIHATYADQLGDMLNLDFSAAPPPPKEKVDEQRKLQEQAAEALRAADAARARALSDAQARLKVERELAAAAEKDIVSQHAARKAAEERAAREAELLAAAKKRSAEESTATRFARDRAESDAKAVDLARQRQEAEEGAVRVAKERAEADAAAAEAAKQRAKAENAAQSAAMLRVQAEKEAEAAAKLREQAEAELEALRAAVAASGTEGIEALTMRIVEDTAAAQAAREAARAALAGAMPEVDVAGLEAKAREAASQRSDAEAELQRARAAAVDGERVAVLREQLNQDAAAARSAREAVQAMPAVPAVDIAALEATARDAAAQRATAEVELQRARAAAVEGERLVALQKQAGDDEAAARDAREAAEAARRKRAEAESALEAASRTRAEAETEIARLRETSASELQRLMSVRKRIEQETAAANAAHLAAAEYAGIDDVMRERMALETQIEAATGERVAAEKALEGLRQSAERERQALEQAKERLAAADLKGMSTERTELKGVIAGLVAEREVVEQQISDERAAQLTKQLDDTRQQLDTARQALASAETGRDEARKVADEARAEAKAAQPLVIGPPPAPVQPRAGALVGFLIGSAVAAAAVYVLLGELDRPPETKAAAAPAVEARAVSSEPPGEPLGLRLDAAFEKIAPREPPR
jgi:putative two-component system response regulator